MREIGRGGMGIVCEAVQTSLERRAALKVLNPKWFQSQCDVQRFQRESRAIARLHHSNIVEVYGVGEQDGLHYFAMRYVSGIGVDRLIELLKQLMENGSAAPGASSGLGMEAKGSAVKAADLLDGDPQSGPKPKRSGTGTGG